MKKVKVLKIYKDTRRNREACSIKWPVTAVSPRSYPNQYVNLQAQSSCVDVKQSSYQSSEKWQYLDNRENGQHVGRLWDFSNTRVYGQKLVTDFPPFAFQHSTTAAQNFKKLKAKQPHEHTSTHISFVPFMYPLGSTKAFLSSYCVQFLYITEIFPY